MAEAVSEARKKLISVMAEAAHVDEAQFMEAVRRRVAKEATTPDLLLFLHTANEYGLDPLATPAQIALFVPRKKEGVEGGVPKPYVTFDGWLRILMSHPDYLAHGMRYNWTDEKRKDLESVTFWVARKSMEGTPYAVSEHTEFLREVRPRNPGDHSPWNQWPVRMTAEKACMQGTRFTFGMYVPDLDDLMQAETLETARAESAPDAPPAQGPIAPAAAIPGARRSRGKKADASVAAALPAPAPAQTVDEFIHGKPEPVPVAAETKPATTVAPSLFPETPKPTERAALPEFDRAESRKVAAALAAADSGDLDDLMD